MSNLFQFEEENNDFKKALRSVHGEEVVSDIVYENTCKTNNGQPYYRICPLGLKINSFDSFQSNIECEGFINHESSNINNKNITRKEIVEIAVKMRRFSGISTALIEDLSTLQSVYSDLDIDMFKIKSRI